MESLKSKPALLPGPAIAGPEPAHVKDAMNAIIDSKASTEEPFYLVDLGVVYRKACEFRRLLPRVDPFYAVKCNPDDAILKALAALDVNFDCASQAEIKQVLDLGVSPSRIIFANPCKPVSHVKFARKHGVDLMTFDNADELEKVAEYYPDARLVLRVLADDSKSVCRLGLKFGADIDATFDLLKHAKLLKLNVVGVSFHVGSGCTDASAFADAVKRAGIVFEQGAKLGFAFSLLDVGGGFPGADAASSVTEGANAVTVSFKEISTALNAALQEHFPDDGSVRVIAEPGRYYASSAMALAVHIIARRCMEVPSGDNKFMYYVNDGVYGSFNCILFDHAYVVPETLTAAAGDAHFASSVWGPTCDSMDCISPTCMLPKLNVGDWLFFPNMGAYTCCAASTFNGFGKAHKYYTFSADEWFDATVLPDAFPVTSLATKTECLV